MFEHVILRRAEGGLPISVGQLAEALLYYQKVHLIFDRGTLFNFVNQLGTGRILSILNRADVSAVYCEQLLGTHTDSVGVSEFYNFVAATLSSGKDSGPLKSPSERLQFELERQGIPKEEARHFTKMFLDRVPVRKFSGNYFLPGGIPEAATRDLFDSEYIKRAVRQAIATIPGGYKIGEDLKFEILDSDLGIHVFTNIDLNSINQRRSQTVPPIDSLTIGHLLTSILEARADLTLASFYGGDFVTSAITSSIIQVRHAELLRRSHLNADSRQQFTEILLPDTPSLAEVIDSGERSFDDFLVLLDRAAKFKDWLKSVNPDEDLIRTYMRDISSEGWIQRLPAKSLRYVLTLALDATNPTAGFIDNFILEKLFSGWRPNHFISSKLRPFVHGQP